MDLAGVRRESRSAGAPIAMAIGCGRIVAGTGRATNPGVGPVTTMDIGSMTRSSVGFGFQALSGDRPGSAGELGVDSFFPRASISTPCQ